MSREHVEHRVRSQFLGVVGDRLEPQHVFAFGVRLQRQQPEVDLEQGQVVPRCLDHGCQCIDGSTARSWRVVASPRTWSAESVTSSRVRMRSTTVSNSRVHLGAAANNRFRLYSTW